ncbi:unnamed protein product [Cylindrotheca closterium]|uniref:Uncharacterized protein n=1 Tax=Cylindrotheca closterium TaxID=2856 RepID=A0AAD2FI84_9STRA|nr:unnamed protein product [Cylindrotheca closterium]
MCLPTEEIPKQQQQQQQKSKKFELKAWQEGGISSFDQTCYADYWDDETIVPSIPISSSGDTMDPFDFGHRMALGKCLIRNTAGSKSNCWGEKNYSEKHWYWAYLAQLDWQWRTGRLSYSGGSTIAPKTTTNLPTTIISTAAWYGNMNANFSVAAYMGAMKANLVPSIKLDTWRKNIEEDPGFQICVEVWYEFWIGPHAKYLTTMESSAAASQEEQDAETKETLEREALIEVYRALWEAHTDIIHAGVEHNRQEEALLPEPERKFAMGWCHMVELFAAMGYTLLSLEALMVNGAGYLPSQVLLDESVLEHLKKNKPDEYQQTMQVMDLYNATSLQLDSMCGFFRRLTRWEWERQQMPITLKILNKGAVVPKTKLLLRILTKIIIPHPTKSTLMERSLFAAAAAVATGALFMKQSAK